MRSVSLKTVVGNISSPEERQRDLEYIRTKYPQHAPVFVRFGAKSETVWRHLMPRDKAFTMLIFVIRKSRRVPPTVGLAFLIETETGSHVQAPGVMTFEEVGEKYAHEDGFIYINVVEQNVFG
jgi:hypothetical protein